MPPPLTRPRARPRQDKCHPQTIAVTASRADGLGLSVRVGDEAGFEFGSDVCGVLLQYPATDGSIHDYKARRAPAPRRPPERRPHALGGRRGARPRRGRWRRRRHAAAAASKAVPPVR